MKTLNDQIYKMTLPTPYDVGDVHVYLLKGEHHITLIDAGVKTEDAWSALKTQLGEAGCRPEDVDQVILTHHHPDHMGLVEYFPGLTTIAAHQKLVPWIEKDEDFFVRYEQFFYDMYIESGVPEHFFPLLKKLRSPLKWTATTSLTTILKEGDPIPGHEEWLTIETPGHAQSHLSFWRKADGALIAGDHLLSHISPNPLLEPPFQAGGERPKPMLQYRSSLEKLLNKKIGVVYPGHGKTFEEAHLLIRHRLKKQEERAEKVFQMFGNSSLTAFQVCKQLFPKQIEAQFGLTMSETIGQLDYLEDTGRLISNLEGNERLYAVPKEEV